MDGWMKLMKTNLYNAVCHKHRCIILGSIFLLTVGNVEEFGFQKYSTSRLYRSAERKKAFPDNAIAPYAVQTLTVCETNVYGN